MPDGDELRRLWAGCREYEFERRVEYRAAVYAALANGYAGELDVCIHRHRTAEAARRCGRRMIRQNRAHYYANPAAGSVQGMK